MSRSAVVLGARKTGGAVVDRLLAVWTHPPDDRAVLEQELRAIYTDPLTLNGVTQPLSELVAFAVRTAGACTCGGR